MNTNHNHRSINHSPLEGESAKQGRSPKLRRWGVQGSAILLLASLFSVPVHAQPRDDSGERIRAEYPELATLLNAFDVTHAALFDELTAILEDPSTESTQDELAAHFRMMQSMDGMMHGSMNMGMGAGMDMEMDMDMSAPYGESEVTARVRLLEIMRRTHDADDADEAYEDSRALNRRTARLLQRGRRFESHLLALYIDEQVQDKQAAVAAAVADYLDDSRRSVAATPKAAAYLLSHGQAHGFQTSFPRLSGFLWSQQWLQLAALEAAARGHIDENFAAEDGVATALERFWNKIGSAGGMTMFPAPVELPMAPAIAPNLYSQSPPAAVILDNLNVLETLVADVLSYPGLDEDEREARIDALVDEFTDKTGTGDGAMEHLLFSLRGGIYNQGGPAVGDLMQSERNRSRAMMNMRHAMIMSAP